MSIWGCREMGLFDDTGQGVLAPFSLQSLRGSLCGAQLYSAPALPLVLVLLGNLAGSARRATIHNIRMLVEHPARR